MLHMLLNALRRRGEWRVASGENELRTADTLPPLRSPAPLLLFYCLLLTAYCLLSVPIAAAHGGGEVQLSAVEAGPYQLTAWMNPGRPVAGRTIHITVALADGEDMSAVLDASVMVEVWSRETGERMFAAPATTEQSANKLYYETDFILTEMGPVEVRLLLEGTEGRGEASYTMEVGTARLNWWLWGAMIGIALVALVVLWRSWGKAKAERPRARRRPRRQTKTHGNMYES